MECIYTIFSKVFDRKLDNESTRDRKLAQNMTYILSEMGTTIGEYGFHFGKNGPFSNNLAIALTELSPPTRTINLSPDANKSINKLIKLMSYSSKYNIDQYDWLDLMASALFVKENIAPSSADVDELIKILMDKRPDLSQHNIEIACQLLDN